MHFARPAFLRVGRTCDKPAHEPVHFSTMLNSHTDLTAAATWKDVIPQTEDRLQRLRRVADDLSTSRTIDTDERTEAISIVGKLLETFSSFHFPEAAEHARAVLTTLDHPGLPQPERLEEQVRTLCQVIMPDLAP